MSLGIVCISGVLILRAAEKMFYPNWLVFRTLILALF